MRVQAVRWKIARRHLNRRRPHRLRWILAIFFLLFLALSGASGAGAMYFMSHLPPVNRFHVQYAFQNARIFDSRGDLLYDMADLSKRQGGRRVVEPLQGRYDYGNACSGGTNQIPRILQNATIATEDATFYKNPGFDPLSIVRAAYQNLTYGHIISGASTITQQMVRAQLVGYQRTLSRKAQEVALAYEVSKKYSKRKILWYYLNSVPYGNATYGAQAAAQVYFHQRICSLDLAQVALLAGLPRAPTLYDPIRHRTAAIARMHTVLQLMRRHGYLHSSAEIQAALRESRTWRFTVPQAHMRYPQFVQYVVDQIQHMPRLRRQLYQGIDVYTTLDPRLQDVAQSTVSRQIDGLAAQHVTNGALVSLDLRPQHYGWILAMVGSAHYASRTGQINMAVTPRQPGSSMKPFNYIWAFTHGNVSPATTVSDAPLVLPDPQDTQHHGWYLPENYDHLFHGNVTLRLALANSLNVPAVKLEYYITGAQHVAQTARQFGMKSFYQDNPGADCNACYALTLGGLARGTRLLEETSAYGVFGSGGRTVPPVAIWQVRNRSTHQVLFCSASCSPGVKPTSWVTHAPKQVLDPGHAYEMTNVLSDNSARCSVQVCEFGINSPLALDRIAAAKTGTTNAFTDNWTVGYVPQMVTGVWVGNADRTPMLNVLGITGAAPIWHDYMESAFHILKLPALPFVAPPDVVTSAMCSQPGSTYTSFGLEDLVVAPPNTTRYPMCRIPERGSMPIPCSQYPAKPPPITFQCISGYYTFYGTPGPFSGSYSTPVPGVTTYQQPYVPPPANSIPSLPPTPVVPAAPVVPRPTP